MEFSDGQFREIKKVVDNPNVTLNTSKWKEIVGEALKKRMALCKENFLRNKSEVLLCNNVQVWFDDGSTFTMGSYGYMENALIKLRAPFDNPQENFDCMSKWELRQCLKALCEGGLSHKDMEVFDYLLHLYAEKSFRE